MSDPKYEFNVPSGKVDFSQMMADDDGGHNGDQQQIESYFDFDHENGGVPVNLDEDEDEERQQQQQEEKEQPLEPNLVPATPTQEEASAPQPSSYESPSANGNGSAAPPLSIKEALKQRQDTPSRERLREEVRRTIDSANNSPVVPVSRRSVALAAKTVETTTTSNTLSPARKRWNMLKTATPDLLRKARGRSPSIKRSAAPSAAAASSSSTAATRPSVAKAVSSSAQGAVRDFKAALSNLRKDTKATSVRHTDKMLPRKTSVVHSAAQSIAVPKPTQPKPFKFATDNRPVASTSTTQPMKATGQMDFSKMLRSYNTGSSAGPSQPHGPTKPRPFNLSGSNRRRSRSVGPPPVGAGSRARGMSPVKRTLDRRAQEEGAPQSKLQRGRGFGGSSSSLASSVSSSSTAMSVTEAKPFSFVERDLERVREKSAKLAAKTAAPLASCEEEYVRSLRGYDEREGAHSSASSAASADRATHQLAPTKPEPFHFASESRARSRRSRSAEPDPLKLKQEEEERERVKRERALARARAHNGVPVIIPTRDKKATEIQPFSFAERDNRMFSRKQEKIEQFLQEEKEKREFKATAMPNLEKPVGVPSKQVLLPTAPKPFTHEIEKRVETRVKKFEEEMEEALKAQREKQQFKAREPNVLYKDPFQPAASDKPLSEVQNFELHSDRRAIEREQYEREKKQKEAEQQGLRRQLEDRRKAEEAEEIRRKRAEAVHKAQPIKHYRPVEVAASNKPLTMPMSPKFSQLHCQKKE